MPKPVRDYRGTHTAVQAYRAQVPWVLAAIAWYVVVAAVSWLGLKFFSTDTTRVTAVARGMAATIIAGQVVAISGAVLLVIRGGRRWTRERSGHCACCDYPRRISSDVCSECGGERPAWADAEWCTETSGLTSESGR